MQIEPNSKLFFYTFFDKLRKEVGIELDNQQYILFLRALVVQPMNFANWKEELLKLCEILWLTKSTYKKAFYKLYWENINIELSSILPQHIPFSAQIASTAYREDTKIKEDLQTSSSIKNERPLNGNDSKEGIDTLLRTPPNNSPTKPLIDNWPEINLQVKDSEKPGKAPSNEVINTTTYKEIPFLFSREKILPFKIRTLKQHWRRLRGPKKSKLTDTLDIKKIIKQRTTDGAITNIKFISKKIGDQHIVWLSDDSKSMAPFKNWETSLQNVLTESYNISHLERYYFQAFPFLEDKNDENSFLFFTNPAHTKAVNLAEAKHKKGARIRKNEEIFLKKSLNKIESLKQKWNKNSVIIIYSDGGASRRKQDYERVEMFLKLLIVLKQSSKRILWINPAKNISDTSAMHISYFVNMINPENDQIRKVIQDI